MATPNTRAKILQNSGPMSSNQNISLKYLVGIKKIIVLYEMKSYKICFWKRKVIVISDNT